MDDEEYPPKAPAEIKLMIFRTRREAVQAVRAADRLGLGVCMRNLMTRSREHAGAFSDEWEVTLFEDVPRSPHDSLDDASDQEE